MPGHDDFLDDYIAYKLCCEDDDDDSSDGCYIATAVYGTYDCPELWVLRRFRDYGLRKSTIGTALAANWHCIIHLENHCALAGNCLALNSVLTRLCPTRI